MDEQIWKLEFFSRFKMEQLKDLLPKDKCDIKSVKELKELKREDIIYLLPELLKWIQDMNYPVAPSIADLLLGFPNEIIPQIKKVFGADDDIWKFWCLDILVQHFPPECKLILKSDLTRLAEKPSEGEKVEEVDIKAKEILKQI